jgi:EPS-associated MarR family transcriptional regulator
VPTELQFRVLRLVESNPHLTQRELSKSLGVSLGSVNYCLNALIAKGSVKMQNFRNDQNKWVYGYLLIPHDLDEKTALTGASLKRKMQEYQSLKDEIEAFSLEVGQLPSTKIDEASLLSAAEPSEVSSERDLALAGLNTK